MTVETLLTELRVRRVQIRAEGQDLRVRAAKGTLTPDLRAALREHKPALLALLRGGEEIPKTDRSRPLPLSFAQQRLWFIDQLEGKSPIYNMPVALRVRGPLHVPAMESALTEIVRRHESLRTVFRVAGGDPVQVIIDPRPLTIPIADVAEPEIARDLNEEAATPFDLAEGPLLRARVLRIGTEDHVVMLTMHHIVSDAWSMAVFIREMTTLYEAHARGAKSPLPELPIQYADYAVWQRTVLAGANLQPSLDYWTRQLDGAPPLLELPADRARPAVQSYRGASEWFEIAAEITRDLRRLAQQSEATLFMTLLAAFAAAMARWTGQEDIVVGSPVANRTRPELEPLIGFFANMLALRIDCSGHPTFRELISRGRRTALDAYAHQDFPFERLVEALRPERTLSYTPVFQTTFQVQDAPMGDLPLPGLEPLLPATTHSKFDFSWMLEETGDRLQGHVDYSTDLFDAATIRRMIGHFQTLLAGLLADPDRCVFELPILDPAERDQIVVGWNQTRTEFPRHRTVADLFEEQARTTPEATALVWKDRQWTYGALNARANRIAHHLQSIGTGPEVLVGISMPRSPEAIAATLAVLKAGGAYVPLDRANPKARNDIIVRDARLSIILTTESLASIEQQPLPSENPERAATAENLAYVIYTSGSTGMPKGTCVCHRSIARLVKNTDFAAMDASAVFLQIAPLAFDASTFELWGSLLNGGRLVIYPEENITLEGLGEVLHRYGVTTIFLTASLFHQMMQRFPQGLSGLRQLVAGGEALSAEHVNAALKRLPDTQLMNGYGPTECTTFAICGPFTQPLDPARAVPIGRPIANTRAYILDRHLQPVPIGVRGELHLGGEGLARGYLNNPALTEERFITNPFGSDRLYKTGDLARYLPDGRIEYLGRDDRQVKVRGFRIELGEIETALRQDVHVREAVVAARKDTLGETKLIAWIVCDHPPNETELRAALRTRVPDSMIPAAFVAVDALPLNANGKVNWNALPDPTDQRPDLETAYVGPRTETERIVANMWRELLHVDHVGIHDNFFDLGGHSLLLAHSLSRLREIFGDRMSLSLVDLFRFPTVHALAAQLSGVENGPKPRTARIDRRIEAAQTRRSRSQIRKQSRQPRHQRRVDD